jgi:hypothetical protein
MHWQSSPRLSSQRGLSAITDTKPPRSSSTAPFRRRPTKRPLSYDTSEETSAADVFLAAHHHKGGTMTDHDRLDEARVLVEQGPLPGDLISLQWLQRNLRLGHEEAVLIASALESEKQIGPGWRKKALNDALQSYGSAALEHGRNMKLGIEDGSLNAVISKTRKAASRLGATLDDLDRARDIASAEWDAAWAEMEHEGRAQDAVRQQIHDEVAAALDIPPW